jgi:hypothetical protein
LKGYVISMKQACTGEAGEGAKAGVYRQADRGGATKEAGEREVDGIEFERERGQIVEN